MKTQNFKSNSAKGILTAAIALCFAFTTSAKTVEHPLQSDTSKMAAHKTSKMAPSKVSKNKMSPKKMDKMAPSKMSKSKMSPKKMDKMAPSKM